MNVLERPLAAVRNSLTLAALSGGALLAPLHGWAQDAPPALRGPVSVTVDTSKAGNFLAPRALGAPASFYNGDLLNAEVPGLLRTAGAITLRYPGGRTTDEFHWSTINKYDSRKLVDFGKFVKMVDRVGGTMVLGVNYGSNLKDNGPGEPAEAAAWVAYCNGKPEDTREIGKDSAGNDWKTVGYWATMRASAPLNDDDGYNFLRIARPAGLNVKYWEVGNEVYANGYFAKDNGGAENDRHVPYPADRKKDAGARAKDSRLGPAAYGANAGLFAKAMKTVDPRISVGVTLAPTTTADTEWNLGVLKASAGLVDFVILHWYVGNPAPPDWKELNSDSFLDAPSTELPKAIAGLIDVLGRSGAPKNLQLAVTEIGYPTWMKVPDRTVMGLFAADAYASLAQDGAVTVDWTDLHGENFLKPGSSQPGPVFFGLQMLHKMLNMRDTFVTAKTSQDLLAVHAARRLNSAGAAVELGLMFVNKDARNAATVKVKVTGDALGTSGTRFDWGPANAPSGNDVQTSKVDGLGNTFTLTVPPHSIADLVIPLAK